LGQGSFWRRSGFVCFESGLILFKALAHFRDIFAQLGVACLDQVIEVAGKAGLFNLFLRSLFTRLRRGLAQGSQLEVERFEACARVGEGRDSSLQIHSAQPLLSGRSL
jgi:hypothetical protein